MTYWERIISSLKLVPELEEEKLADQWSAYHKQHQCARVQWCCQCLGAKDGVLISSAALDSIDLSCTNEIANGVDAYINVAKTAAIQSILASRDSGCIIPKNRTRTSGWFIQTIHK